MEMFPPPRVVGLSEVSEGQGHLVSILCIRKTRARSPTCVWGSLPLPLWSHDPVVDWTAANFTLRVLHISFGACIKFVACRAGISAARFESVLVGHRFPRCRPSFLKSPKKRSMELDGYCPDLQMAFEYQGEQHYVANSYFNRLTGGFAEQVDRDRLKAQQCDAEFEMVPSS